MFHGFSNAEWVEVDRRVEEFERARRLGIAARISEFLPERESALYHAVLRELVRVDLELRAETGEHVSLSDYEAEFPELRDDPETLEQVVYEEFRVRAARGDEVDLQEIGQRYGVDISRWPRLRHMDCVSAARRPTWADSIDVDDDIDGSRFAGAIRAHGFECIREIGRGAFSRVYLARQSELADRLVVLKVSPDLFRESWTLARLQHPHIVPIHSTHSVGPLRVVCMPYLGATTLDAIALTLSRDPAGKVKKGEFARALDRARVSSGQQFQARPTPPNPPLENESFERAVIWIGAQLADGLAHAHEQGILHRDLKPANVLLSDDGVPMLLDFNLAASAADSLQAIVPSMAGTPVYMAPEQMAPFMGESQPCDARADIYGLALVLWELLTGQPAFPPPVGSFPEQLAGLIAARRSGTPSLRAQHPWVSRGCAAILSRCLEPEPARRYQSARELQEDFQRHLEYRPLRFVPEPALGERIAKWVLRRPRFSSAAAIGVIAAVLITALTAMYVGRGEALARVEARETLARFQTDVDSANLLLSLHDPDPPTIDEGEAILRQALGRYQLADHVNWQSAMTGSALDAASRHQLRSELGSLFVMLARVYGWRAARAALPGARATLVETGLGWNRAAEAALGREGYPTVLLQRAKLLHLAGRDADERAALDQASRSAYDSTAARLLAASELIAEQDYEGAIPLLDQALAEDSRHALGWLALGFAHARMGRWEKAEACLTASLALQPASYWAHFLKGQTYFERGNFSQALPEFDRALALRSDFIPALVDRSLTHANLGNLAAAVSDLNLALAQRSAPTRLYFIRARLRARLGDEEGARGDEAEGLRREPNDAASWVARGVARQDQDPEAALADFENALRLAPNMRAALQNKAAVLSERLNRPVEAIEVLDQVVVRYPDYARGRGGRGVLLARAGRRDDALDDAREALRLDSGGEITYQVACIYALTSRQVAGDRDEAFRLLKAALELGFGHELLDNDPDLDPLRTDPRFAELRPRCRDEHSVKNPA